MSLTHAVRQATSLPAQIMGFRDRSLIREGLWADLVIFDPETLADKATFGDPHQLSSGIEHVWVHGRPVVQSGLLTGGLPGKVLSRSDWRAAASLLRATAKRAARQGRWGSGERLEPTAPLARPDGWHGGVGYTGGAPINELLLGIPIWPE